MFKNKKNTIHLTLSVLLNFFEKLILMHSNNFENTPKNLGINPFFLKDYQKASKNFSLKESVEIIHLLKQTDLKSKGINNNRINSKELMFDLILDIIRI
jgi:DNA polymerase-3 subunit delta